MLTVTLANGLKIVSDFSYLNKNINNITGSLDNLTTQAKTTLVTSINEVNSKANSLQSLIREVETTLFAYINEINNKTKDILALYDKNVEAGAGINGWAASLVSIGNGRTQADKNSDIISVKDFGAKGDGVTNDTIAINKAIAAMIANNFTLYIPAGEYLFDSTISITAKDNICIKGDGRQKSKLVYVGTKTDIDLITIGDGLTSFRGLQLEGFNIDSRTRMTNGVALKIRKCQNAGNTLHNVSFGQLNSTKNLWSGCWFDNVSVLHYIGFEINTLAKAIVISGDSTSDSSSDILLDKGTITFSNVGVHVGGGFGGLYVSDVLFFGNSTHCLIDTSITPRHNREFVFGEFCVFDGSKDHALVINDALGAGKNITINSFIASAGKIGTGGIGINIHIKKWTNSRISINSGQIFNAELHNIQIDDASTFINIGSSTQISNANGFGIFASVLTYNINYLCTFKSNGAGKINDNIRNLKTEQAVVNAAYGTLGNASASVDYYILGSILFFNLIVQIDKNGSGYGAINVDLPIKIRQDAVVAGRADSKSGKMLQGILRANTKTITIMNYDGSYPATDGETLKVSGCCEIY